MTKKTTRKRSSRKKPAGSRNQTMTIAGFIILIILVGCYAVTGSDPAGLFDDEADNDNGVFDPSSGSSQPSVIGSGGDWWQLYFTDPATVNDSDNLSGSIPEQLIALIDGAQDTIHIAAFEFDLLPVAEALIAARNDGVEIRWITDDEHGLEADEDEGLDLFPMMEKAGIEIKDDDRSALMHNKFWIFDNRIVWTGSTNITQNGNFRNNNNTIIIESTRLAAIYEREFAEMWAGEFGPTSPSTPGEQALTIQGSSVQALFGAEDEVVDELIALVNGAQSSIYFMAFAFTHDGLGTAVLERANAGVDVFGIFETRASETEFSELPILYCSGLAMAQDGNPGTFHHKVFIIDEEIVVTGSLNFSDNANDSNDENVLIIGNRDIAEQYLLEFDRRWAESVEPDPADMNCG